MRLAIVEVLRELATIEVCIDHRAIDILVERRVAFKLSVDVWHVPADHLLARLDLDCL